MNVPLPVLIGASLKSYFSREEGRAWFHEVSRAIAQRGDPSDVDVFVIPSYLQIHDAMSAFADTGVRIGAQDVSAHPHGAFTGEIPAAELSESGVAFAEVGHAERRRLFGESDADAAAKTAAALTYGVTPLLCLGESERVDAPVAAAAVTAQLRANLTDVPTGGVVIAYEPVWAIGAASSAPREHIVTVARALRRALNEDPARRGSRVIYGGSAGPGLLTALGDDIDGLFLGRSAHDVSSFIAVVDEAAELARHRLRRSNRP
ncbi:triose-phosphate isomerase family protein [Microbacterium sp.]|uniref:triose-phosphate isomerase family protein n=1 Tax=Microbacterium sp. TaxID=51671 RepID=UPI002602CAE3|nr:triose-phosphate isomerase family protein [Microbacterium sp.]